MDTENKATLLVPVVLSAVIAAAIAGWVGYTLGMNASRNPALGPGAILPPPGGVRDIMGTIEGISGQEIVMKANQLPFAPKAPAQRTVVVGENTVIEKLTEKSPETARKEMNEFIEKSRTQTSAGTPSTPVAPPLPFDRKTIALKDLKNGDLIMVSANEDITNAKKFTATRISVQISPSLPPIPSAPNASPAPLPPPPVAPAN